jgi:hypothetical protein
MNSCSSMQQLAHAEAHTTARPHNHSPTQLFVDKCSCSRIQLLDYAAARSEVHPAAVRAYSSEWCTRHPGRVG